MRILVFGDSITYGAWDSEGGYVERLKKYAHEVTLKTDGNTKIQVINLGIGGDTSTKIVQRLKNEIDARYSKSWPIVIVFMVGTNDERIINGSPETSLEEFSENIQKICNIAKSYTNNILFLGTPSLSKEIVILKNQEYANERITRYDSVLRNIVDENGALYENTFDLFNTNNGEPLHCYDGLHPNNAGHEILASIVMNYVDRLMQK